MDWGQLLTYVAVVVSLVSAGGLGLQRSRVSALRGDLDDERGRNQSLRQDVTDLQTRDKVKDSKIAQLESDLRHAEHLALRETKWADLDEHLERHHTEARAHWDAEEQMWQQIEKALRSAP